MLIEQGRTAALSSHPWAAIRLCSDISLDETVLRIARWARAAIPPPAPFQLLFPIQSRDLAGITMLTPYLLARSRPLSTLDRLSALHGIRGLESDAHGHPLEFSDAFVSGIIRRAEEVRAAWSSPIRHGSFARIMVGPERMLCGTVEFVNCTRARIRVSMRSRDIVLDIPIRALKDLGDVPLDERTYHYVEGLLC